MATHNSPPTDDDRRVAGANNPANGVAASNRQRPMHARPEAGEGRAAAADDSSRRSAKVTRASDEPNSIRPTKRRSSARPAHAPAGVPGSGSRSNGQPAPLLGASHGARSVLALPGEPSASEDLVPDDVRRRFVQVGRTYYFPDGARAFTDRGKRLTTPSENTEVIRSLVTIAQARGWHDITVSGTERFRKEAWFAAKLADLTVRGYKASEFENEHLARLMARKGSAQNDATEGARSSSAGDPAATRAKERPPAASGNVRDAARDHRGSLIVGRLADHGRATYLHNPREPMSYFVKLETARGERTIWGVDLGRAFRESLTKPQPGDDIGLRAVRQDPVTVKTQQRDADGRVLGQKDLTTHRNRWIVEKRVFFEERKAAALALRDPNVEPKRAVLDHPALVGTYLSLRAAELAAKQFRDPQDQQRFVVLVRNALADSVARGEPLPPVRLREQSAAEQPSTDRRASRSSRVPERDRAPVRG